MVGKSSLQMAESKAESQEECLLTRPFSTHWVTMTML